MTAPMPDAIWERLEDLIKIAGHYGYFHQLHKTIEEMNELEVEIKAGTNNGEELLIGELADVMIMVTQVSMFFHPEDINAEINRKIDRQLRRIEAENKEARADG